MEFECYIRVVRLCNSGDHIGWNTVHYDKKEIAHYTFNSSKNRGAVLIRQMHGYVILTVGHGYGYMWVWVGVCQPDTPAHTHGIMGMYPRRAYSRVCHSQMSSRWLWSCSRYLLSSPKLYNNMQSATSMANPTMDDLTNAGLQSLDPLCPLWQLLLFPCPTPFSHLFSWTLVYSPLNHSFGMPSA